MTAEKNLNIIEVNSTYLEEFLLQKKFEGYTVIGAEQTANSKSFIDFKFPEKCLILLGYN